MNDYFYYFEQIFYFCNIEHITWNNQIRSSHCLAPINFWCHLISVFELQLKETDLATRAFVINIILAATTITISWELYFNLRPANTLATLKSNHRHTSENSLLYNWRNNEEARRMSRRDKCAKNEPRTKTIKVFRKCFIHIYLNVKTGNKIWDPYRRSK